MHDRGEQVPEGKTFTLESSLQPMGATYAIAILNQGQLHLNPLLSRFDSSAKPEPESEEEPGTAPVRSTGGGILQMRPSLAHVNPVVAMDPDNDTGELPPAELKKVTVKYQSRKQERIRNWQKNSYANRQKEFEEEPFIPLQYCHPDRSFEPFEKMQQLFFVSGDGEGLDAPFTMNRTSYLDYVVGEATQSSAAKIPYGVCSKSTRQQLPLSLQIKQLMKSVTLMQFQRIRKLISIPCKDTELITALEEIALLQEGVWIIKSQYDRAFTGSDRLISVRDLILSELHKRPEGVFPGDITRIVPTSHQDLRKIFDSLCESETIGDLEDVVDIHRPKNRILWKLRVPADPTFALSYPEVSARSQSSWEEMDRQLTRLFKKSDRKSLSERWGSLAGPFLTQRTVPALDGFFSEVFAQFGVCNLPFLRSQLQKAISAGNSQLDQVPDERFRTKLGQMADQLHSAYFLRVHPNEAWNKVRVLLSRCVETDCKSVSGCYLECFQGKGFSRCD